VDSPTTKFPMHRYRFLALFWLSLFHSVWSQINPGFPYGSEKVRGVNLGGWLVLEVSVVHGQINFLSDRHVWITSHGSPQAYLTTQEIQTLSMNGPSDNTMTVPRQQVYFKITGIHGSQRVISRTLPLLGIYLVCRSQYHEY